MPAGDADEGQWTDGGHSGYSGNLYRIGDKGPAHKIVLSQMEGHRGAHTLKYHSGKTATELLSKMGPPARWWDPRTLVMYRNGRFDSEGDANYHANDIIASNADIVSEAASRALEDAFLTKRYGHRTGLEGFRDDPYSEAYIRTAFGVGVHIIHHGTLPAEFYVNTAYPRNDDPMTKSLTPSPALRAFTDYLIQDYEFFESLDDVIRFGLRNMEMRDPNKIGELTNDLRTLLVASTSDRVIGKLWNSTNAEFGGHDSTIRAFLERTPEILETEAPGGVLRKVPTRRRRG